MGLSEIRLSPHASNNLTFLVSPTWRANNENVYEGFNKDTVSFSEEIPESH